VSDQCAAWVDPKADGENMAPSPASSFLEKKSPGGAPVLGPQGLAPTSSSYCERSEPKRRERLRARHVWARQCATVRLARRALDIQKGRSPPSPPLVGFLQVWSLSVTCLTVDSNEIGIGRVEQAPQIKYFWGLFSIHSSRFYLLLLKEYRNIFRTALSLNAHAVLL